MVRAQKGRLGTAMMEADSQVLGRPGASPPVTSAGGRRIPELPKTRHQALKGPLISTLEWFGGIGEFAARIIKAAYRPPYEGRELLRQMDEVGAKSLPLVALAGAAIGVVLSLHTRDSMVQFGAKSLLP